MIANGNSMSVGPARLLKDVICVQSMPRLGFTAHYGHVAMTLPKLGIDLHVAGGAYWHHSISLAMRDHINDGHQFILANDYDTPMKPRYVLGLYDILQKHPEIDSIQGVQVKRGTSELMYRVRMPDGSLRMPMSDDSKVELLKIGTGHFGLTLFRVSALKKLSLPWMYEIPDAEGFWSDKSLHPDIAFWHNMETSGCQCYQANRILLPHINEFVMSPSEDFSETVMQTIDQFEQHGLPGEGGPK